MLRRFSRGAIRAWNLAEGSRPAAGQSRGLKEDTGIVGLSVDPEARVNLRQRLEEVLEAVKCIPQDAAYRQQVEATMQYRLKAVDSQAPDEEVEEVLESQLESLMLHCRDELELITRMAEWKPWDVPADHKVDLLLEEPVEPPAPPAAPPSPPPPPPKK